MYIHMYAEGYNENVRYAQNLWQSCRAIKARAIPPPMEIRVSRAHMSWTYSGLFWPLWLPLLPLSLQQALWQG